MGYEEEGIWNLLSQDQCKGLQTDGIHYDSNHTAAPVTNEVTIRIMFTIAMMAKWRVYLIDINGRFEKNKRLYLKIPEGFEQHYKDTQVLKLNRTIYGLKQSAQAFWSELLKAMKTMGFQRSYGDPCCYYKVVKKRLVVCLSWVDDCLFLGKNEDVVSAKNQLKTYFECDDLGYAKEYVGCKINMDQDNQVVKFRQPILIRSLEVEFNEGNKKVTTPAIAGQSLQAGEEIDILSDKVKKKYQAGVGKLLYIARWSKPEICNAVRELSRFGSRPQLAHYEAMMRVMDYCVDT
jgi:Reverse transcriptase (RNA-dependent DNA polymerase)